MKHTLKHKRLDGTRIEVEVELVVLSDFQRVVPKYKYEVMVRLFKKRCRNCVYLHSAEWDDVIKNLIKSAKRELWEQLRP